MVDLTHKLLEKLAEKSCYSIKHNPMVFFGIRGMLPIDVAGTDFAASQRLALTSIDHRFMRCTLGQWIPGERRLAVFPGSTVPHVFNIQKWVGKGGAETNMLMLGKYLYQKGRHKDGKPGQHRAFRQAIFFPVWRSNDDLDYDQHDILDNDGGFVWDNVHCASNPNLDVPKFGSAGCQVVAGIPGKPDHGELGPWKKFIDHAYHGPAMGQKVFEYLLFSGFEVARLADQPDATLARTCRFGSEGDDVRRIQERLRALDYPGFLDPDAVDGVFGRTALEAVVAFQRKTFGVADGVVGPQTAEAMGVAWGTNEAALQPVTSSSPSPVPVSANAVVPLDWMASAVAVTCGFENAGDPYVGVSGNFDGMGISCGAMQWNIGQGSLQPMVKAVGKAVVVRSMPTYGAELWDACQASPAVGTSMVTAWQVHGKLPILARDELSALMGSPEMRAEQDRAMTVSADKAFAMAKTWAAARGDPASDKRAFMWCFDTVCQNGSLKGLTYDDVAAFIGGSGRAAAVEAICASLATVSGGSKHAKDAHRNATAWRKVDDPASVDLLVLSFLRAAKSLAQWRHVVLNRKGTIAAGMGWVNSTKHDLSNHGL